MAVRFHSTTQLRMVACGESRSNSDGARHGRVDLAGHFGGLHHDRRRDNSVLAAFRPANIHPDQQSLVLFERLRFRRKLVRSKAASVGGLPVCAHSGLLRMMC